MAIEAADIVLVRSDPRDATAIMALSRATYRKMVQNLFLATGYNLELNCGIHRHGVRNC